MNYCTQCRSFYEKPGTCNCFAYVPQRISIPVHPIPTYPSPYWPWWETPVYLPTITWGGDTGTDIAVRIETNHGPIYPVQSMTVGGITS